jgi:CubicO group peptidase (beta-lactamase class C family)
MKQHGLQFYNSPILSLQERRRLVLALAIGIFTATILGAPHEIWSAMAKDCNGQTPLPTNVRLITPGAEVPEAFARFAGAWIGAWRDQKERRVLCHTLVIEEVLPNGYSKVIYSIGTHAAWNIRQPNFWRVTGRIVDGVLRFHLPVTARPSLAYRFDGETLLGTGRVSRVSLARIADIGEVNCGSQFRDIPQAPAPDGSRDRLRADDLLASVYKGDSPVHNNYFLPIGKAAPALHVFKGSLSVGAWSMFSANHGCAGLTTSRPAFSAAFFTHGEHLVPVVRDILQPPGTIILSPGKVWSEPGDRGMSRASFPFVLVNQFSNEAHNGLASFLYDDTGVSALRLQVVQETAAWAKFDSWGQAPMTYTPDPLPDENTQRAQFVAELKQQTPIRPWSELPKSAKATTALLERFDGDAIPEDISANGLIVDGVVYLRGCNTRYGPYPYCRDMRHGVFSVTKSLGAAVALLRLAQKYGDEVFDLKIKDYVPVTADHDGWERVTFGDALNMATGIGDLVPEREPNDPLADENKPKMFKWERARTAKEKLDVSFSYGKHSWGPGEVLRYNSTHTFVLAAAMDNFLKQRAGANVHLWDMVTNEVLHPIGIFHAPMMHTVEADGGRGIPLFAIGLYPTIDDIAKLITLLQNGGRYQDRQLLSAAKLAEALDKSGTVGLPTGERNRFGDVRYHLSFWSVPYKTDDGCFFQIPYMAGYGGNLVILLPNGLSAFRFADGFNFDVEAMVLAGESLRRFCSAPPAQITPSAKRQPLTVGELNAVFSGHTFYGEGGNMFAADDGVIYRSSKDGNNVGKWRILSDGKFCRAWWERQQERCYVVYQEGESLELYPTDRWGKVLVRRAPGNPEGY